MFMGDLLPELRRGALQCRVEAQATDGSALLADLSWQRARAQYLTKCRHRGRTVTGGGRRRGGGPTPHLKVNRIRNTSEQNQP